MSERRRSRDFRRRLSFDLCAHTARLSEESSMEYRKLGRTGLTVSRLCLGTMTFGFQTDEAVSGRIMETAADAGITFFDTANVYPLGGGDSRAGATEEIVGRWLKG